MSIYTHDKINFHMIFIHIKCGDLHNTRFLDTTNARMIIVNQMAAQV